ncbi:MAG: metallopeptidase TldD-related protein [Thermaerobacter sp.]|nr:metallopeptidase TldD-related protein [Thermaerobacter sp.]
MTTTTDPFVQRLTKLRQAGEQVLLTEVHREHVTARVRGGHLEGIDQGHEHHQAVRVLSGGRLGYQGSRTADWDALLDGARAGARGAELDGFVLSALGQGAASDASSEDSVRDPVPADLAHMALAMGRALSGEAPEVVPQAQVQWMRQWTRLVDGDGVERRWMRTEGRAALSGRVVRDGDFMTVGTNRGQAAALPDPQSLLDHVRTRLAWGQRIVSLDADVLPIVFMPPVGFSLLAPLLARLSAPAVAAKTSPWSDALDTRVANAELSLVSDPGIADGPRSVPWDDEGTATRRVPLIDRGMLRHWILDRRTAHQLGQSALGLGFSGELGSPPTPRPSNVTVNAGSTPWADLVQSHPRLLILEGWVGGRPVNPLRGEMAGTATALYLVDHGAVVGRVKNVVVSVNALEAWGSRLSRVGDERHWVGGGMMQLAPAFLPPILVQDVAVAAKS